MLVRAKITSRESPAQKIDSVACLLRVLSQTGAAGERADPHEALPLGDGRVSDSPPNTLRTANYRTFVKTSGMYSQRTYLDLKH